MRILVVEDEQNLREAISQILHNRGFEVDSVSDGKAGLHAAMSGLYDLVMLDLMLPKLNGFEILKKLRKAGEKPPVILCTARGDNKSVQTGLQLGADAYITKPFNVDELLTRIRYLTNAENEGILHLGKISLDTVLKTVCIDGKTSELSEFEAAIMERLINNESSVVPLTVLQKGFEDDNLDAYIMMLTRKLQYLENNIKILHIKEVGYKLMIQDNPLIDWDNL